nr:ribonuclease H-like domain-containing protein [Tanacetum cinerariifolium]
MQGTSLTKHERECKLYDAFDKFTHIKGESLHMYYLRFTQLINDTNIYNMKMEQFQVNTKFLISLPPEWNKFVTDVKLVKDLHTSNYDQLHAYLEQQEHHANGVHLIYSGFIVPVFSLGDDLIAYLNKAMAFLIAVALLRGDKGKIILVLLIRVMLRAQGEILQVDKIGLLNATTVKEKTMLVEDQEARQILDEEQLAFLADPGIPVVLMANISIYGSDVISEKHVAMPVIDNEETLILEEESRSKMSKKAKDLEVIAKKISNQPIDYEKLNRLADDFGKRFTPQQELLAEQAFWLRISNPTIESSLPPVRVEVPSELPKVSLVNESLKKLKFQLAQFNSVVKKRKTPNALIEGKATVEYVVQIPSAITVAPRMFKLDLDPLAPKLMHNRESHIFYLKHTQDQADILREDQPRSVKTRKNNKNRVKKIKCNDHIMQSSFNTNYVSISINNAPVKNYVNDVKSGCLCAICGKCMIVETRHECVQLVVTKRNESKKYKSAKKQKKQNVWKSMGHVFTKVGLKWKPTGRTFTIVGNSCPLTRFTSTNVVPSKQPTSHSDAIPKPEIKVYCWEPKIVKYIGSSKVAKIVESNNANHLKPNHTWGSIKIDIPWSSSLVMTGCPYCTLVSGL